MHNVLIFLIIFLVGEFVAFFAFKLINYFFFDKKWEFKVNLSVIKGNLERLFLFICLVYNLPHALIAFGAIKIGTRFKSDAKISNDYFFFGNMFSLLLSVCYFALWRLFMKIST